MKITCKDGSEFEASYFGFLKLEHGKLFTDIKHFFNKNMEEIAHIWMYQSQFQKVVLFDPPRKWGKSILNEYKIERI
jgi:hypothetical protein